MISNLFHRLVLSFSAPPEMRGSLGSSVRRCLPSFLFGSLSPGSLPSLLPSSIPLPPFSPAGMAFFLLRRRQQQQQQEGSASNRLAFRSFDLGIFPISLRSKADGGGRKTYAPKALLPSFRGSPFQKTLGSPKMKRMSRV